MAADTQTVIPRIVTVSGTTLFEVAARYYGSATLWNRIAAANDLTDPKIIGVVDLVLPRDPIDNGGILGG